MATMVEMNAKLNLNIQDFTKNLTTANNMVTSFAKSTSGIVAEKLTNEATNTASAFKDVSRIVQGILISQTFYTGLRSIREATSAVWDFTTSLEFADMAYTSLFRDSALAGELINVLKDFAAVTPFAFSEAEESARRLLAYGIEYKNVMYVMEGVLAASTVTGNPDTIEAVSRALGQISTKGKLYNEELRQLAEAGIPVYEILQEKLGLTEEQLASIGETAVPASVAINALVDGMNERFGGALDTANTTMIGLISNLKDNLLIMGAEIVTPLYNNMKALMVPIVDVISGLRSITETKGIGGLFEELIPEDMQGHIRTLIANLMNLWTVVKVYLGDAFTSLQIVAAAALRVFNAFAPVITAVLDVVGRLAAVILANDEAVRFLTVSLAMAAAGWVLFRVKATATMVITGIITGITKAVAGLTAMLTFAVKHPFWALLIVAGGLLVGLSGGFNAVGDAIDNMFKKLTQFNGVDPDTLLLPSQEERTGDINKFNEALDGTSDAMDDLADSTGDATKAAKGLLSFDEVFKLNEPDEGTDDDLINWDDFEMPDLGSFDTSLFPDIPSFEAFSTDFVDNFLKEFEHLTPMLENIISSVLGAALLGGIGYLFGGPIGGAIGAALGALAGWFWPKVADYLELTDVGTIAVPIATALGGAIGFAIGGPAGASIGAGIGLLVGWLVDEFSNGIYNGDWSKIGYPLGMSIGGVIGFIAGGPGGAAIGVGIGALVGYIADLIMNSFNGVEWNFAPLGEALGMGIGAVLTGPLGAILIGGVGETVGSAMSWLVNAWDTEILPKLTTMGETFGSAVSNIQTKSAEAGEAAALWLINTYTTISSWLTSISDASAEAGATTAMFFTNMSENIRVSLETAGTWVSVNFTHLVDTIKTKTTEAWTTVTTGFTNISNTISNKSSEAGAAVATFFNNMGNTVRSIIDSMVSTVSSGLSTMLSSFANWVSDLWNSAFGKLFGWLEDGIKLLTDFFNAGEKTKSMGSISVSTGVSKSSLYGHATGGVFNREHVASFAEGNKAEAIIPLENDTAMQPFVDAVSLGVLKSLMPVVSSAATTQTQELPPVYVGTLIADETGLRELERRMRIVRVQEEKRGG